MIQNYWSLFASIAIRNLWMQLCFINIKNLSTSVVQSARVNFQLHNQCKLTCNRSTEKISQKYQMQNEVETLLSFKFLQTIWKECQRKWFKNDFRWNLRKDEISFRIKLMSMFQKQVFSHKIITNEWWNQIYSLKSWRHIQFICKDRLD